MESQLEFHSKLFINNVIQLFCERFPDVDQVIRGDSDTSLEIIGSIEGFFEDLFDEDEYDCEYSDFLNCVEEIE